MGERKQKRKQREKLIELANELKKRELEISRTSQAIDELKMKLGDRERKIAAAEAAKPKLAQPISKAEGSETVRREKPVAAQPPVPQAAAKPAEPSTPHKPSGDIVAEINEVAKSIFWDYSQSVHEISSQISTVTAATLCAAVTCILENRSFDVKDVFMREIQKLISSGSLGATYAQPSQTGDKPESKPVPQAQPEDQRKPAETEAPEPIPEAGQPDVKNEDTPEQTPESVIVPAPPKSQEDVLRIGSVIEFQKLGDQGFRNDESIVRVELPEGIQYLPGNYFYDCVNLKEVWLPDSLLEIGPYTFYGCKSLETVHIGTNAALREIGEYAFAMCENLKSFTVPAQVESIGTSAFRFCSSLEEVLISADSKLRTIGSHLFHSCTTLDNLLLPDSVTVIPTSMCYSCTNLRKVVAKGVDTIEDYAFYGDKHLRSVSIRNMKTIAQQAFEGCAPDMEIDYTLR